jgi:2-phosphosulfolactate phosphatase
VRVHVAFTPSEAVEAPLAVVVDVLRATSTIAQALASGYRRVLCCADIEDARALQKEVGDAIVGGERRAVRVPGFEAGASPREFLEPRAETLILTTTNGTRAIVTAAGSCDAVLLGSLLNLDAVAREVRERAVDTVFVCAGFQDAFALDDAYCSGRIAHLVDGEGTDAAVAAEVIAGVFPSALDGLNARTYGPPGLEDDIRYCAQESVLDAVPLFARMVGPAAEIVLTPP